MSSAIFVKFPEVFTGGKAPAPYGTHDPEMKTATPVYRYGWIVSCTELYQAIHGEPACRNVYLSQIYLGAESLLSIRWREKGYDDNEFNPKVPSVRQIGPEYVVIFLTCNDSESIIKSVMDRKELYEECRNCAGRPKMMELEPAWIRWGINYLPKELSDPEAVSNVDQ